jgi:hypothetical protein
MAPAGADVQPERNALLGDIRGGMKLRKAVTIDKSKPRI